MTTAGTITVTLDAKTARFLTAVSRAAQKLAGLDPVANAAKKAVKKLNDETGGLSKSLTAAAAAAGAFASVWKSFNIAEQSSGAAQAAKVFKALGGNIDELRRSVGGMVSDAEIIKKANLAQTMGINTKTFKALAQGAQAAAAKTGQAFDFMFDSIITGTARQSKLILDNLGIMVNMAKVSKEAAKIVAQGGAKSLEAAKNIAFQNEVMAAAARMAEEVRTSGAKLVNEFGKFRASVANASDAVGEMLAPAFTMILERLTPVIDSIRDVAAAFKEMGPIARGNIEKLMALGIVSVAALGLAGSLAVVAGGLGTVLSGVSGLASIAPAALRGIATGGAAAGGMMKALGAAMLLPARMGFQLLKWMQPFRVINAASVPLVAALGANLKMLGLFMAHPIRGFRVLSGAMRLAMGQALAFVSPLLTVIAVAGGIAVAAGAIRNAWEQNIGGVQEKVAAFGVAARGVFDSVKQKVSGVLGFIGTVWDTIFEGMFKAINKLPVFFLRALAKMLSGLSSLSSKVSEFFKDIGQRGLANQFSKIAKGLTTGSGVIEVKAQQLENVVDNLAETLNPRKAIETAVAFWQSKEGKAWIDAAGDKLKAAGGFVGDGWKLILKDLLGKDLFDRIKEKIGKIAPKPPEPPDLPTDDLDELGDAAKEAAKELLKLRTTSDFTDSVFAKLSTSLFRFAGLGQADANELGGALGEAGFDPASIGDAIGAAFAKSPDLAQGLSKALGFLAPLGNLLGSSGLGAIAGKFGLGGTFGALTGAMGSLGGAGGGAAVGSLAPGIGTAIGAIAGMVIPKLVESVTDGLKQGFQLVTGIVKGAIEAAVGAVRALHNALGQAGDFVAGLVPDQRGSAAIKAALNPTVGTALALAAVLAIATPSLMALGAAAFIAAQPLFAIATGFAALAVVLTPVTAVVLAAAIGLSVVAAIVAGLAVTLFAFATALNLVVGALIAWVVLGSPVGQVLIFLGIGAAAAATALSLAFTPALAAATLAMIGVIPPLLMLGMGIGLAAAALSLLGKTEAMGDVGTAFEASMDRVVATMEPLGQQVLALAGLFDVLMSVVIPLFDSFAVGSSSVVPMLFEGFRFLALGIAAVLFGFAIFQSGMLLVIAGVSSGIAAVIEGFFVLANWLNSVPDLFVWAIASGAAAMAEFFGQGEMAEAFQEAADTAFESAAARIGQGGANPLSTALDALATQALATQPDLNAMAMAIQELASITFDEAKARAEDLVRQKETEKEIGESQFNVARGFKVAAARHAAAQAGVGMNEIGAMGPDGGAGGPPPILIDTLQVFTESAVDLFDQISEEAEKRSMQERGTTGSRDGQNNGA